MIVKFTNYAKKVNSTARPTEWQAELDVRLKDDTSLRNPVIIVRISDFNVTWNYAYIEIFYQRYYRVTDIVIQGIFYEVSLAEDDLASNRTAISNTNAYIQYCADSTEVYITDTRMTANIQTVPTIVRATPTYLSSNEYIYVLSVIGVSTDLEPNVISPYTMTYVLSDAAMWEVANSLFTNLSGNVIDDLAKYFSDAANCIVKINQLPMSLKAVMGNTIERPIYLGKYKLTSPHGWDVTGTPFNDSTLTESLDITIPWQTNDFRRGEPYTSLMLYLPFVGVIDLSTADFIHTSTIYIDIQYSLVNRQINYAIKSTPNTIVGIYSGQYGYTVPTSSYNANMGGLIGATLSTVGTLAGALTGSYALTAGSALSGVSNMTGLLRKTASMVGDFNGSGMEKFGIQPTLIATLNNTIAEPSTYASVIGRPYCKVDRIGNHSGFIQCVDASFGSDCLDGEAEAINELLNSGFYFE